MRDKYLGFVGCTEGSRCQPRHSDSWLNQPPDEPEDDTAAKLNSAVDAANLVVPLPPPHWNNSEVINVASVTTNGERVACP